MFSHSTYWSRRLIWPWALLFLGLSCLGCETGCGTTPKKILLATTTSTRDSGMLDLLLPPFEEQHQVRVDVIATGTGKALKLGEMGDVDVVFVHARQAEDAFMAAGHGLRREDVMFNTFELLGPPTDPAGVRGLEASAAMLKIAESGAPFLSRGDDSGTHKRELQLWKSVAMQPDWPNYRESGQGMGATLTIADQMAAYILTDRGTFLNFRDQIDLVPLATQSDALKNPYGIIVVKLDENYAMRSKLADAFVDYLISPPAQNIIANYQLAGKTLFVPLCLPQTHP